MRTPKLVTHLEHGLVESQNERDARIEDLWGRLDTGKSGELDLKGLKKGLRKIDHRGCICACLVEALTM